MHARLLYRQFFTVMMLAAGLPLASLTQVSATVFGQKPEMMVLSHDRVTRFTALYEQMYHNEARKRSRVLLGTGVVGVSALGLLAWSLLKPAQDHDQRDKKNNNEDLESAYKQAQLDWLRVRKEGLSIGELIKAYIKDGVATSISTIVTLFVIQSITDIGKTTFNAPWIALYQNPDAIFSAAVIMLTMHLERLQLLVEGYSTFDVTRELPPYACEGLIDAYNAVVYGYEHLFACMLAYCNYSNNTSFYQQNSLMMQSACAQLVEVYNQLGHLMNPALPAQRAEYGYHVGCSIKKALQDLVKIDCFACEALYNVTPHIRRAVYAGQ